MGAGGLLAAGCHLERPKEAGHKDLQLLNILLFRFHHAEHQTAYLKCADIFWQIHVLMMRKMALTLKILYKKKLLYLPISLPHGFRMRRSDVLVYDLFPASATEPSPEKALHLFDFSYVGTTHPQPLHLRVDDVISVQRRSPTTAKNVLSRTATCAATSLATNNLSSVCFFGQKYH